MCISLNTTKVNICICHSSPSSHSLTVQEEPIYLTAARLWQTWLPTKALTTLRSGGYYKIDLAGRQLQLVALNTNLYLESNTATRHNYQHDPANQWHWLQRTLKKAQEKHKTVILFGHAPPGVFEHNWSSPGTHWLQHSHNIRWVIVTAV